MLQTELGNLQVINRSRRQLLPMTGVPESPKQTFCLVMQRSSPRREQALRDEQRRRLGPPIFIKCNSFFSVGKYVCHHAVLARDQGYYVGARKFTTISDVVDYFKDHPLGEITLKQEVRLHYNYAWSNARQKSENNITMASKTSWMNLRHLRTAFSNIKDSNWKRLTNPINLAPVVSTSGLYRLCDRAHGR